MSFSQWSTDGYGIFIGNVDNLNFSNIMKVIKDAPHTYERYKDYLQFTDNNAVTVDDFDEYEFSSSGEIGIHCLIADIISEIENIFLEPLTDCYGRKFVLFLPYYPWANATDTEKNLTRESIDEIFSKYMKMFNINTSIKYHSVSNFG